MALESQTQYYVVIYQGDSQLTVPSVFNTPPSDEGISHTSQLQHKPILLGTSPSDVQSQIPILLGATSQIPQLESPIALEANAGPIMLLPATIVPAGKIDDITIASGVDTSKNPKKRYSGRNLMELTDEESKLVRPGILNGTNIEHLTPEELHALKKYRRRLQNRLYARASRQRFRELQETPKQPLKETFLQNILKKLPTNNDVVVNASETPSTNDEQLEDAELLLQLQQSTN